MKFDHPFHLTARVLVTGALLWGCEPVQQNQPPPSMVQTGDEGPGDRELSAFLTAREPDYRLAIDRAAAWLGTVEVDPHALRERGLKGKKKLTEHIDAYYRLWSIAPVGQREAYRERVLEVSAPTRQSVFHDMDRVDDRQFKQDSTSYLRAAYLMDRMGLDVGEYRTRIEEIKPRLDGHMSKRGPHQRYVFSTYYQHFGLDEPFPLKAALGEGLIARRSDPREFSLMDCYHLTHEVFAPYDYGEDLDVEPFDDDEREYLRHALEYLVDRYIQRNNVDIVAEFVSSMRMLRLVDSPQYRRAIDFLLDAQHPDGSWGNRDRAVRRYGELADAMVMLHTTSVTMDALILAFHQASSAAN